MKMMNPITAVTDIDPYQYYRHLGVRTLFYYDEELKLWIAASAAAVTEVLTNENCRVRPADEPVPKALVNSAAGQIFGNLVRMNDGERHHQLKTAVAGSMKYFDLHGLKAIAEVRAQKLLETLTPSENCNEVSDFAFQLPLLVVAALLGIPCPEVSETAGQAAALAECFAPGANEEKLDRGMRAAEKLLNGFRRRLETMTDESEGLLYSLARCYEETAKNSDALAANAIGFMTQAYEATAGLIGNTFVAMSRDENIRKHIGNDPTLISGLVKEVVRFDPPVQNTRRFVSDDTMIAGQKVKAGETILVVLGAANYDETINPDPERLDMFRKNRRSFTFGAGVHECPGQMLAETIAETGVRILLENGVEPAKLKNFTYRKSLNTRIPIFSE